MTKLERINGAIIGLEILRDKLEDIKKEQEKKTGSNYFIANSSWVEDLIKYQKDIFKNVKIKELEKKIRK